MRVCVFRPSNIRVVSAAVLSCSGLLTAATPRLAATQSAPVRYDGGFGHAFTLPGSEGVTLTAENLRVVPATGQHAPARGTHFVGFTLRVKNDSRVPVVRAGRLMEGLRATGTTAAPGIGTLLAPESGTADDETREIAPGAEYTFSLSGEVPNNAKRLVFRGTFVTDPHHASHARSYTIDLGDAPAYTPPADTIIARGTVGYVSGIRVKVLRAITVAAPAGQSADGGDFARILAQTANASNGANAQNRVTVGVEVEVGNPLTTTFYVQPLTLVTLENASGTRTYNRVLALGSSNALEATDLPPRKQTTGFVFFSVPRAELSGLRARFNPTIGQGTVVVALGIITP